MKENFMTRNTFFMKEYVTGESLTTYRDDAIVTINFGRLCSSVV